MQESRLSSLLSCAGNGPEDLEITRSRIEGICYRTIQNRAARLKEPKLCVTEEIISLVQKVQQKDIQLVRRQKRKRHD